MQIYHRSIVHAQKHRQRRVEFEFLKIERKARRHLLTIMYENVTLFYDSYHFSPELFD